MTSQRLLRAVVLTFLLALATPAFAAAPIVGIWSVEATDDDGSAAYTVSVHESGAAVILLALTSSGQWSYAIGTRSGDLVTGLAYFLDGTVNGPFALVFTPTSVVGEATYGGERYVIRGTRVF